MTATAVNNWAQRSKGSRMAMARGYVRQWAPYLAPTLYAFVPIAVEDLTKKVGGPLAVTERLVLLYEPAWVDTVDPHVLATGLAHEVCHDQLRHIARGSMYTHKKRWGIASDLFINGMLKKQLRKVKLNGSLSSQPMWSLPDWVHLPEKYGFPDGLTADAYYRLLEQAQEPKEGDSDERSEVMCGNCGGVSGNSTNKALEQLYNEAKGRSEADCKNVAQATSKLIKAHMSGPERGLSPGGWSEFFEIGTTRYFVPWKTKLGTMFRQSIQNIRTGGVDYSMRRPSARSYLRGWPLPGLVSYDPEIMFIVDSSGSMGKQQIGDALRVCSDVMLQCGIRHAWFMEADAEAQRVPTRINPQQLRNMKLNGRGGTDFGPALAYAQGFKPRPSLVMYITDGGGAAPATAPKEFHTVWCVVPSDWGHVPANWGTVVVLDDTKTLRPAM